MNEDALAAFRANDRSHRLPPGAYDRIEQAMLDTYQGADVDSIIYDPNESSAVEDRGISRHPSHMPGRIAWLAVAAALLIGALVSLQLVRAGTGPDSAGPSSLGDFCDDHIDPLADQLDLLRANPTVLNVTESHRLLGLALDHLNRSDHLPLDIDQLVDRYERLSPGIESTDGIIEIANLLGHEIATLSPPSPRCDLERLALNQPRSTDPLGRPTNDG